jgi:Galactokinase
METGVERRLTDGQYNQRRKECEEAISLLADQELHVPSLAAISPEGMPQVERLLPVPWLLRARHVVGETQRTRTAASALMMGDRNTLGRILFEGHHHCEITTSAAAPRRISWSSPRELTAPSARDSPVPDGEAP